MLILSDIRKHDLTKKFRHIYVDDIEASPSYDHSTIDVQGEDAEALNFNEPYHNFEIIYLDSAI